MVSQVGLNTGSATLYNPLPSLNTNNNLLNSTGTLSDYSDDIMMSNINFKALAAGNAQGQNTASSTTSPAIGQELSGTASQTTPQLSFTQSAQGQQQDNGELAGYLTQRDKNVAYTESGNRYTKTGTGKVACGILGFLAPLGSKIVSLVKGGSFKELFKFKQLAVACPVLAAAGIGIGAVIDGFINSKRAQAADTQTSGTAAAQAQTQQQTTPQMDTVA